MDVEKGGEKQMELGIKGLTKQFKDKTAVDHVDLKFETTILRMKDLELVILPCELVSAFGRQIKKTSTAACCLVFSMSSAASDMACFSLSEHSRRVFSTISAASFSALLMKSIISFVPLTFSVTTHLLICISS